MRVGTKSLLFGAHQFILHPVFVTAAWWKIYHELPDWKVLTCIIVHDWGYWGSPNMDGAEGKNHPYRGASFARKLFGHTYYELILYHSRFTARAYGAPQSKLCFADKIGIALTPAWIWVFGSVLSGEWKEYRAQNQRDYTDKFDCSSPWKFIRDYKLLSKKWLADGVVTL